MNSLGRASVALVRAIDPSLVKEALRLSPSGGGGPAAVCLETARTQHAALVDVLKRECGLRVVRELPSDSFPDSVFIEDTAVAIGSRVLVTVPGALSRQGETERVRSVLQSMPGVDLVDMAETDGARLDGGDVLFTGQELLVGLSHRTNAAGAEAMQQAFPEIPVRRIDIKEFGDSALHLKSVVCGSLLLLMSWLLLLLCPR